MKNEQRLIHLGIVLLLSGTLTNSCRGQTETTTETGKPQQDTITENSSPPQVPEQPSVSLSMYEYEVVDTAEFVTFRLYVRNGSDSLVVLDRVEPSCGCILATIQKSFARKEQDGEIYVGLSTKRMSDTQPYTVDVYTTQNPDSPMRLYIRKKTTAVEPEEHRN